MPNAMGRTLVQSRSSTRRIQTGWNAVFCGVCLIGAVEAQNFSDGFQFFIPPDDATSQRFLPDYRIRQIRAGEFVTVGPDGHFSVGGKRIRFWGTNSGAAGAFPNPAKAGFIADHVRKLGFNLIRLHHLDNNWTTSLFQNQGGTRRLNASNLNRLEKYVAELKRNGVYVDMNLHVSRTVQESDGIAGADSILNFGKGVFIFDPQLIELQQEYARQVLRHVNPYTGLALAADPVMAMVEITNENSLYRMWRDGVLKPQSEGGDLMARHSRMLDGFWNDFLVRKYGSTDALRSAWNQGMRPEGVESLVRDGGFETDPISKNWTLELHETAKATMAVEASGAHEGQKCAKVQVTASDGTDWHIQWKQVRLSLKKDTLYSVSFAARCSQTLNLPVSVMQEVSPWGHYGDATFQVANQWRTFRFSFRASEDADRTVRLSFMVGARPVTFWVDAVRIVVAGQEGLADGESLESRTVRRNAYRDCANLSDARVKDLSAFFIGLQNDYFDRMSGFLKRELGVKVPITGTNWNVGPGDMATQSRLDYVDNHAYWEHPQFPGIPWSSTDWFVNNTPMVRSGTGGTVPRMFGGAGFEGKPFTVSEYNHPFPNRYQTEGMLFFAGYGAFHDTDGLMLFLHSGGEDWETDFINGFFDLHRNTAMMALSPSCAWAYRNAYVSPSEEPVRLAVSNEDLLLLPKNDGAGWEGPSLFPPSLALVHAVRNTSFDAAAPFDPASVPGSPANPYTSDTGEIVWDTNGLLAVGSERFAGFAGFMDRYPGASAGPLRLDDASDFATLTWCSLTGRTLSTAGRSLLTLSAAVQNTGMVWDGETTVHDRWGGPPTRMKRVWVRLSLSVRADSIRIHPLDPTGAVLVEPFTVLPEVDGSFDVTLNQNRYPTVWFGLERFAENDTLPPETPETEVPASFHFYRNFPNPFKTRTTFRVDLPEAGRLRITILDTRGRLTYTVEDGEKDAGIHEFAWTSALPSGIYFCRCEFWNGKQRHAGIQRILLLK